jgi:hypothetical protein
MSLDSAKVLPNRARLPNDCPVLQEPVVGTEPARPGLSNWAGSQTRWIDLGRKHAVPTPAQSRIQPLRASALLRLMRVRRGLSDAAAKQ